MKRNVTVAIAAVLVLASAQAQTNSASAKSKGSAAPVFLVDKVVANPRKFKGTINVSGRVGKMPSTNGLFALTCEDACVSMPVRFSGAPPQAGADVVVRGQITKDATNHYLFDAQTVTPKR